MKDLETEDYLLSTSSESEEEEEEDVEEEVADLEAPLLTWNARIRGRSNKMRKLLTKQLSMKETTREVKWQKRRRQILERRRAVVEAEGRGGKEVEDGDGGGKGEKGMGKRVRSLTDEDLDELRGCIDLGFGFNEDEGGRDLRNTVPALEFYFAVNRQRFLSSPALSPTSSSSSTTLCSTPSPRSTSAEGSSSSTPVSWTICSPGDNPQHVKTRLRHWAQAVACSIRQSCY